MNMTLAAGPPEEVAEQARDGLREGYACFKVKVGLPDDVERVAAVREAVGPWPAIRVDANGAWSVDEAVHAIRALEAARPRVRRAAVPHAARAGRGAPARVDADRRRRGGHLAARAAPGGRARGVRHRQRQARRLGRLQARRARRCALAREHGLAAFLSSTLDGPWGIAAALQLAASEGLSLACGLATLELFDGPVARALPAPRHGHAEGAGRAGARRARSTTTSSSGSSSSTSPEGGGLPTAARGETRVDYHQPPNRR